MISDLEEALAALGTAFAKAYFGRFSFTSSFSPPSPGPGVRSQSAQSGGSLRRHQAAQGPHVSRSASRRAARRDQSPRSCPSQSNRGIDQKTLDEMKRQAAKPALEAPPPPSQPAPEQPKPQPTQPIPPTQQAQGRGAAPRRSAHATEFCSAAAEFGGPGHA